MPEPAEILRRVRELGVARPRDLPDISRSRLRSLCDAGLLRRIGRGLYVSSDAEATEHHELALVGRLVPNAVICLLSSLRFHGLTTQAPHDVWIAIGNKAHAPRVTYPAVEIVRLTGRALEVGIEQHVVEGVAVRVFDAAKTVADCFKFRNRIGLDVALEALRDYRRLHRGKVDQLWHYAGVCRIEGVLRPYLEAT